MPFRLAKIFLDEIPLDASIDIESKTPDARKEYVITIRINEKTKAIFGDLEKLKPLNFHGELVDPNEDFFLSEITEKHYIFINK